MVDINDLRSSLEEEEPSFFGKVDDIFKSINTGMARTFGIPRAISDVGSKIRDFQFETVGIEPKETPDFLPTGEQIQELGSRVGMAFAPGEEPDTLAARTFENIGAAAPVLAALPLTAPILAVEAVASVTAAAGGKFLQSTEWGKRRPELARGFGEIGGGITGISIIPIAKFLAKGGSISTVFKLIKSLIPKSEKRALRKLAATEFTPEKALKELERMEKIPEGKFLLPGQAAGTPGIASLTKTVEEEVPKVAAIIERQRISAVRHLEREFRKTGNVEDARLLLQQKLALKADQATKAFSKIEKVGDSAALSVKAEDILSKAQKEGSKIIDDLWIKLPKGSKATGSNLNRVMREELENITEGGSINQIPFQARQKLGTLKFNEELDDFELVGGTLFNPKKSTAEAKALHQFYSLLGSEKEKLGRFGGQGNKIRITNKLREAVLDDLDAVGVGGDYRETIKLTRQFHNKFTKGTVGRILGRARGETPSPVTALEDIIGEGGVKNKENILQALAASPKMKGQVQEFLKVKFAEIAVNDKTHRIDVRGGNKFLEKFGKILDDLFPELKRDFKDAIARQSNVDEFIGTPTISQLSPLIKEKSAVGFFLGRNPGEEMSALLNMKTNRTAFLGELVKTTKTDPTGKAFRGLQNSFTEELLKHGNIDDINKLSGTKMIKKLASLRESSLKSGLFSKEEYEKLQRIGQVLRKIEIEKGAKVLKGGIINDALGLLVALPGRFIGARIGGRAGQDMGSSLVLASAGSKTTTDFLKRFTNDEAREILIRFVTDKKLAKDLLTKVIKLKEAEKATLFKRILDRLEETGLKTVRQFKENPPRIPVTGAAPAAGSIAESISGERDIEDEEITRKLESLLK